MRSMHKPCHRIYEKIIMSKIDYKKCFRCNKSLVTSHYCTCPFSDIFGNESRHEPLCNTCGKLLSMIKKLENAE